MDLSMPWSDEEMGRSQPSTPSGASQQQAPGSAPSYVRKNRAAEAARRARGEEDEDDENDGYGPSVYNDGRGIRMTIVFTPFEKPDKKARRNAKKPQQTFIDHFHEDMNYHDWLVKATNVVKRPDLLNNSALYNSTALRDADSPNSFSLKYTVPRKVTSEVEISSLADFNVLVEQAKSSDTAKEGARCKIVLVEHEVKRPQNEGSQADDESDEDSGDGGRKKSKRKKTELNAEELEQDEVIAALTAKYRCNDRDCTRTPCYLNGPNGEHIHLTHAHLRMWAAAIVAKVPGVNTDTPPNNKMFEAGSSTNTTDLALLARRRAQTLATQQQAQMAPIHISFAGLADMIHTPATAQAPPPPAAPQTKKLPPRMKLDLFCTMFELDDGLKEKLEGVQVIGPHVLRLITDKALLDSAQLTIGELATLRDAEERWLESV